MSYQCRAYCLIPSLGYTHETVNHSVNFVDPVTGAHTQNVKGFWSVTKRQMRKQGLMNTSSNLFSSYLLEILWRKRFQGEELLIKLFHCISEQYPICADNYHSIKNLLCAKLHRGWILKYSLTRNFYVWPCPIRCSVRIRLNRARSFARTVENWRRCCVTLARLPWRDLMIFIILVVNTISLYPNLKVTVY